MASYYLPARDGDFLLWCQNFSTKITAAPTTYGLTSGQATAYAAALVTFDAALTAATTPATRTRVTVAAKDVARSDITALSRAYAALVQAFPTITPSLLETLGLTVRSTGRTPVPPPTTFPLVSVLDSNGFRLVLAIADESTPNARRRPYGVIGAEVFVKIGTTPPVGIADCVFRGLATRFPARFDFAEADAGKTAYVLARWSNRRSQTGPLSAVTTAVISN